MVGRLAPYAEHSSLKAASVRFGCSCERGSFFLIFRTIHMTRVMTYLRAHRAPCLPAAITGGING